MKTDTPEAFDTWLLNEKILRPLDVALLARTEEDVPANITAACQLTDLKIADTTAIANT